MIEAKCSFMKYLRTFRLQQLLIFFVVSAKVRKQQHRLPLKQGRNMQSCENSAGKRIATIKKITTTV